MSPDGQMIRGLDRCGASESKHEHRTTHTQTSGPLSSLESVTEPPGPLSNFASSLLRG